MSQSKPRLIFFGNEQIATGTISKAPTFRALIEADYEIAALVVSQTSSTRRQNASVAERLAKSHQIPTLSSRNLSEIKAELAKYRAQAGVLVAYGQLVPEEIIELLPAGIVNIHPSLLPNYRGSTPIEQVILDGAAETGVSLMKLVREMDAGPVFAQGSLKLTGNESKQVLADKLSDLGRKLLIKNLPKILSGDLKPVSQNESAATYTKKINKSDGVLDWQKPIAQLEHEIRAYAGWPKSTTNIFGQEVIITKAHAVPSKAGSDKPSDVDVLEDLNVLMIYASDGYLCIDKLKPAGRNEMSTAEFLRGYRKN